MDGYLRTIACVILSICAFLSVAPGVGISWRLTFSRQIVVIGLLLTIMSAFCAKEVVKTAFLLYEARFGQKKLDLPGHPNRGYCGREQILDPNTLRVVSYPGSSVRRLQATFRWRGHCSL